MRISWMVARVELRRRRGSLIGLGLIVTLVTATVLVGVVGARRTASSIDRFREATAASDGSFQSDSIEMGDEMLAIARDVPGVEAAAARHLVNVFPVDGSADIAVMSDPDGAYGVSVDRPHMLSGRMPALDAPDEILLNELAAQVTGLAVGDHIEVRTWSTDDLFALFEGTNFPGFNGPRLDLRVVGIGRVPEALPGDVRRTGPFAIGSPAFIGSNRGVGSWPPAVFITSHDGADALGAVATALAPIARTGRADTPDPGYVPLATTAADVYLDTSERTVDTLATGLLVFSVGAAIAGAFAIGQVVNRHLAAASVSVQTLRSLGMPRTETAMAQALPVMVAAVGGVVVGVVAAVVASPVLPTGLARRAEVDPGVWVDPLVLGVGGVVAVGLIAGGSLAAARRRHRSVAATVDSPAPGVRTVARAGASPVVVTGVHMASGRSGGRGAVPLRSALVGLAIGLVGVTAAGVIASSVRELVDHPDHWGWAWSTAPDYFGDGDIADLETRLADDDRLDAVANSRVDNIVVDGEILTAYTIEPVRGSISNTILSGRLPTSPGEVALGRATLESLGVGLGDSVEASTLDETTIPLTVVGTVVLPPTDEYRLDVGALLTPDGLTAASQQEPLSSLILKYPAGADPSTLEAELHEDYGLEFGPFTRPQTPGVIRNLGESRDVAAALAAFFVVIGGVGLAHSLLVSTRRRRRDFAVLRTLGLFRGQVRRIVVVQALVLGLGAVVAGVPVGLIVGRVVWRGMVSNIGALADPQVPWLVLAMVVPITVAAVMVAAWWPGRAALRRSLSDQLRPE